MPRCEYGISSSLISPSMTLLDKKHHNLKVLVVVESAKPQAQQHSRVIAPSHSHHAIHVERRTAAETATIVFNLHRLTKLVVVPRWKTVNNAAVDGLEMRHPSDGFRSNSLHRERNITLALTIPPEHRGKRENMVGRRKRNNETKAKNCLSHRGRTTEGCWWWND